MKEKFSISPIGYVRNRRDGNFLEISPEYLPGLAELESFSHILVLWWSHLSDKPEERQVLQVEQPYQNSPACMGLFATRSPQRPNPIAVTTTPILQVNHNNGLIRIAYIDAEDDTPIIDIKPYHPSNDRVRDVSLPSWCSHWPKYYEDSANFDWEAEFISAR